MNILLNRGFGFSLLRTQLNANKVRNAFRFENQNLTWTFEEFEVKIIMIFSLKVMLSPMDLLNKAIRLTTRYYFCWVSQTQQRVLHCL